MTRVHELTIGAVQPGHSLIDRVISGLQTAYQRWTSRRELAALLEADDRLLSDVGITRADLRNEVSKPFWAA